MGCSCSMPGPAILAHLDLERGGVMATAPMSLRPITLLRARQDHSSTKDMRMTSAAPRALLRALSSFLESQPTPTQEGGAGPGLLPSPLPGPSFAVLDSPWCSSHDAAKCTLCQGGGSGRGLGTLWAGGCLWFWSPLPALWRAFDFPGEECLAVPGGRRRGGSRRIWSPQGPESSTIAPGEAALQLNWLPG